MNNILYFMNNIFYICVYVPVCVYSVKKNNKMTICMSATHFPHYIL